MFAKDFTHVGLIHGFERGSVAECPVHVHVRNGNCPGQRIENAFVPLIPGIGLVFHALDGPCQWRD
jgi:hypothetical protein